MVKSRIMRVALLTLCVFCLVSLWGTVNLNEQQLFVFLSPVEASDAQPLGHLKIGDRVVDNSWQWEYKTDESYSGSGLVKPVVWIVVAKNHYGSNSGVTLLSEQLIARFPFDNSTDRGSRDGSNHWGNSGTTNATYGLRPWLNSSGIHAGEGFYRAFSESFKAKVVAVTLPNREWQNGINYTTEDKVFIPTLAELGDTNNFETYVIGDVFTYFENSKSSSLKAHLDVHISYWTRSPVKNYSSHSRIINQNGFFPTYVMIGEEADSNWNAVRPVINLSYGTPVSIKTDNYGIYSILDRELMPYSLIGDINGDGNIDVKDVALIFRHILDIESLSSDKQSAADVDKNNVIDVRDATLIVQMSLGLIGE